LAATVHRFQHFYRGQSPREHRSRPAPYRGGLAVQRYIVGMCGRATKKLTWEKIVALYRLTLGQPAVNTRDRSDGNLRTKLVGFALRSSI
jgi:hypothetical protein